MRLILESMLGYWIFLLAISLGIASLIYIFFLHGNMTS